jgi:hypothetical protein
VDEVFSLFFIQRVVAPMVRALSFIRLHSTNNVPTSTGSADLNNCKRRGDSFYFHDISSFRACSSLLCASCEEQWEPLTGTFNRSPRVSLLHVRCDQPRSDSIQQPIINYAVPQLARANLQRQGDGRPSSYQLSVHINHTRVLARITTSAHLLRGPQIVRNQAILTTRLNVMAPVPFRLLLSCGRHGSVSSVAKLVAPR